jgi:hypothetical protein
MSSLYSHKSSKAMIAVSIFCSLLSYISVIIIFMVDEECTQEDMEVLSDYVFLLGNHEGNQREKYNFLIKPTIS